MYQKMSKEKKKISLKDLEFYLLTWNPTLDSFLQRSEVPTSVVRPSLS